MSTRCNIIIEDQNGAIQLYRHCDGYPEAVLPDLKGALKFAWKLPRFEASDFAAAIVAAWKSEGGGYVYIDGNPKGDELLHADIEYLYHIYQVTPSEQKFMAMNGKPIEAGQLAVEVVEVDGSKKKIVDVVEL